MYHMPGPVCERTWIRPNQLDKCGIGHPNQPEFFTCKMCTVRHAPWIGFATLGCKSFGRHRFHDVVQVWPASCCYPFRLLVEVLSIWFIGLIVLFSTHCAKHENSCSTAFVTVWREKTLERNIMHKCAIRRSKPTSLLVGIDSSTSNARADCCSRSDTTLTSITYLICHRNAWGGVVEFAYRHLLYPPWERISTTATSTVQKGRQGG